MFQNRIDNKGMLPLLGAISLVIATTALILGYFLISVKKQSRERHQCRLIVLESFQHLTDGMNEIIKLNPTALKLQLKEKKAHLMIRSASTPPQMALAIANLTKVKSEQLMFRKKQLRIVQAATHRANLNLQIHARREKYKSQRKIQFLLKPLPPSSDSPTYVAYPGMEKEQATILSWRKQQTINSEHQLLKGECVATVKKERQWFPVLAEDKVL